MDGWIKLWRQFTYWEWYSDLYVKSVFLHLLISANHKDGNWRGMPVFKGQFVTSLEHLSNELHLSVQQVRTALNKLKSTNEITIKSTNKFSVITICKYDDYQGETTTNQQAEQQTNNKQITNNQQTNNKQSTTNNNDKNIKNEKKDNNVAEKSAKTKFNPDELLKNEPPEIRELLMRWIDYKKTQFGKAYKSDDSFKTFVKKLNQLSGGDFETAKAIIEQSIANCYQGIFELKKSNQNGNNRGNSGNVPIERIVAAGRAWADAIR